MTRRAVAYWIPFVLAISSTALASNSEADAAFARGTSAYQHGDNRSAAQAFEEAYRLSPHGVAKYSAALAWEAAGEKARAADDYRTALDSKQLDARQEADSEKRLERLERDLGRIRITAPAGATVRFAHVEGAAAPLTVHVAPGSYQVVARFADGRESSTRVEVGAGETFEAAIEAPPANAPKAPKPANPPPKKSPAKPGATQRTVGFVALGAGVVTGLTSVYLGTRALAARNEYYDSNFHDQDAHDRAASLRTATNIGWGVTGVLGVTGAVLILTAPRNQERAPSSGVSLLLGPTSAALRGRF